MFTIVHSSSVYAYSTDNKPREEEEEEEGKKERDNLRVNFVDAIKTIGWRRTILHMCVCVTTIEFGLDGKEKINYDDDWTNKKKENYG